MLGLIEYWFLLTLVSSLFILLEYVPAILMQRSIEKRRSDRSGCPRARISRSSERAAECATEGVPMAKTVIVTGGSRGNRHEIAKRLAAEGFSEVVNLGRNVGKGQRDHCRDGDERASSDCHSS
jgi:hypothetical protein